MTGELTNSVAAEQLVAYVSRIERLEEEIGGLNDDKREVYAEARSCGFCMKTLRRLIQRRRKNETELQEEDDMLDMYEQAVASLKAREEAKVKDVAERDPLE